MAYTNHLLFNNIFLKNLRPTEEEIASANYLVHESARDWYRNANFSSPQNLVETWIRPLINQQTLDLVEASSENHSVWYLVAPWEREIPLALCYVVGGRQGLAGLAPDGSLPKGQHWMIQAVNLALEKPELNLRWVILTNGDQWRLLDAHSLRRYEAYLEIDLMDLLKGQDDQMAAYLFHHIVRLENSLERDEINGRNKLDEFLEQSIQATESSEKYLKTSVSDNLNTPGGGDGIMAHLCMGLVQSIDPSGRRAFTDAERDEIYRNATYLLYRLLFIFYAEARNLLPMDRDDYHAISLNRLVEDANAVHLNPGNDLIQQTNLWDHLNTLFNAIQYSDEYMGIPPYNGGLFENDDKDYLNKHKIINRFLAEALVELAYMSDPKEDAPAERIDYRDLSVRHLGSLYEGMIEYRLFITEEELLARRDKDGKVKYLSAEETERKPNDEVLQKGKVYFAQSPHERKATGTHYTAEDLVERLVKQTVLRLLTERWQDFEPKFKKWLAEIDTTPGVAERDRLQVRLDSELEQFVETQVLSLRACDPAMGSGHFLVYIAHEMTNFILWVLSQTPWPNPSINLESDVWRKRIVENCLYGVDINQMAVELAKLSLWLATMQLGQPLSFLDHHLKQGNSILGSSLEEIEALLIQDDFSKKTDRSVVAEGKGQYLLVTQVRQIQQKIGEANTLLQKIARQLVARAEDIHQQELDYEEVEKILLPYKRIGDLIVAQKMGSMVRDGDLHILAIVFEKNTLEMLSDKQNAALGQVTSILGDKKSIHWSLEFPQVFLQGGENFAGFDIIVGNPPFLGGSRISSELGMEFLSYLKAAFTESRKTTDLCAYFFRKAFSLLTPNGFMGFVATNTIGQGDSRETGLAEIKKQGGTIIYADRYIEWKGEATVEVNLIAITKNYNYPKELLLDGHQTPFISSFLDTLPDATPQKLAQNNNNVFVGAVVLGKGFWLSPLDARELIRANPQNTDCLFWFLSGQELNSSPTQSPDRYVICFHDWPIEKAKEYSDLYNIVKEKVKPQRDKVNRQSYREKWWLFAEYYMRSEKTRSRIGDRLLTRATVSDTHAIVFVTSQMIFSNKVILFPFTDEYHFSLLQSNVHELWVRRFTSTMRTDINYSPSDCFANFPFPQMPTEYSKTAANLAGHAFYEHRQKIMSNRQLGLTKTYNLFNNPTCQDDDILQMRRLQTEMDYSVLACYGWEDIDQEHDFYPNDRKKIRFSPSPAAQREIYTRLIALNQQVAKKEAAQGLIAETIEADESEDVNKTQEEP